MKSAAWWMLGVFLRLWSRLAACVYGGEGLNIPLMFMPSRWIAATLRRYGAEIGEGVRFRSPLTVHNAAVDSPSYYKNLSVGADCYLGRELFLDLADRIVIEDQVTLSHRVMIVTHTDAGPSPLRHSAIPTSQGPVIIRRGAYVGVGATILEGVEIGEGSVVGAGALVTKSVPASSVVVGVPARVIKTLPGPRSATSSRERCVAQLHPPPRRL